MLQLLKAIFGTNLAGQWDSHVAATALRPPVSRGTARSSAAVKPGIYHVCLNQPYIQLTQAMASTTTKIQTPVTSGTTGSGSAAGVEHDDSTRSGFYAGQRVTMLVLTCYKINCLQPAGQFFVGRHLEISRLTIVVNELTVIKQNILTVFKDINNFYCSNFDCLKIRLN